MYSYKLLNDILSFEDDAYDKDDFLELVSNKTEEVKTHLHILTESELYDRLGNKKDDAIISLCPLIYFIKNHMDSNGVFYISQKVTSTNHIYNNSKTFNKWVTRLMQMECIYRLDIPFIKDERPYYYYVCKPNFDIVLNWCLNKKSEEDYYKETIHHSDDFGLLPLNSAPTFNANISNIGGGYSDNAIIRSLQDNYPLLLVYQLLVNELNESIGRKEEKIEFAPRIHRYEGKVASISIRAYSPICNYPSFKNVLKDNPSATPKKGVLYRETYLRERLGDNYKEYDIKGSIARISHAISLWNKKPYYSQCCMGDLSEDVYRTIFEPHIKDLEKCFELFEMKWEDIRPFFKSIFMMLFFGGSISQIKEALLDKEEKFFMKKGEDSKLSKVEDMPFHHANIKKILTKLIKQWKTAVEEYCDIKDNKSTEVFFDESCVYLEVRRILRDRGIDVIQVFDGFYFSEEVPQDIEEIFHQAFITYITKTNLHASYYACIRSKLTQ